MDKEKLEKALYEAIMNWHDDALRAYEGVCDLRFAERVCEKTGLTLEEYGELMGVIV